MQPISSKVKKSSVYYVTSIWLAYHFKISCFFTFYLNLLCTFQLTCLAPLPSLFYCSFYCETICRECGGGDDATWTFPSATFGGCTCRAPGLATRTLFRWALLLALCHQSCALRAQTLSSSLVVFLHFKDNTFTHLSFCYNVIYCYFVLL